MRVGVERLVERGTGPDVGALMVVRVGMGRPFRRSKVGRCRHDGRRAGRWTRHGVERGLVLGGHHLLLEVGLLLLIGLHHQVRGHLLRSEAMVVGRRRERRGRERRSGGRGGVVVGVGVVERGVLDKGRELGAGRGRVESRVVGGGGRSGRWKGVSACGRGGTRRWW